MYGQQFFVHRSRCLVFGGALTADQEKETRAGWDASILQAPYDKIRDFQNSYGSLVHLLSDASTAVFKIRGLLDMIANKTNEDVSTRMQLMDLMRSVFRSVVLDADQGESFDKVQTQFSGVGDVVEHINGLISSVTEIPQTVLFGRSPAGMNATGESDIRIWYDRIESYHKEEIEPQLERILEIIAPDEGYKFKFVPLWQPLPKEQAETRKLNADADAVYMDREALMPEEVTRARFGPDGPQEDIVADMTLRLQAGIKPTTLPPTAAAANATAPTTMK
jgi:phage-related protein (TIGR01555 family)